jgi:hypothetical protein
MMTKWQKYQNSGWWITKAECSESYRPMYYTWDDYDHYNYCESGLFVEWMNTLKEMNT